MIVEDPLEKINLIKEELEEYGSHAGLKVNIQKTKILRKNMTLQQEKELEQKSGFTVEQKVKYLGIWFSKKTTLLYINNYLKVLKEIEGKLQKWRNLKFNFMDKVSIIKKFILPLILYLFQTIPTIFPKTFF